MANILRDILASMPRYLVHDLINSEFKEKPTESILRQLYKKTESWLYQASPTESEFKLWDIVGISSSNLAGLFNSIPVGHTGWREVADTCKLYAAGLFKSAVSSLRDFRWGDAATAFKSYIAELINEVVSAATKNIFYLACGYLVVVAAMAWWLHRRQSRLKDRYKELPNELAIIEQKHPPEANDRGDYVDSSENAVTALASTSVLPATAKVLLEDDAESQVPVNFVPTVDVGFVVTSTHYVVFYYEPCLVNVY